MPTKTNILLSGFPGSGKTTSLRTLLPEYTDNAGRVRKGVGLHPFLISFTGGYHAVLGDNLCGVTRNTDVIHHCYLPIMDVSLQTLLKFTQIANRLTTEQLVTWTDPDRIKYQQLYKFYGVCNEFVCDGCGQSFGSLEDMDPTNAVVLDDFTAMGRVTMQQVIGSKPVSSKPEYFIFQQMLETFCDFWWGTIKCHSIILGHLDRETDPASGISVLTLNTIGQRLTPKIVVKPDEVVLAERGSDGYHWSTDREGAILKSRSAVRKSFPPSFTEIIPS